MTAMSFVRMKTLYAEGTQLRETRKYVPVVATVQKLYLY